MNLLLSRDLLFASQLTGAAQLAGAELQAVDSPAVLLDRLQATPARQVILDLSLPGLDLPSLLPQLLALRPPPTIIAFAPHVHEQLLQSAAELGCHRVLSRGQLHRSAAQLFAPQ